MKGKLPPPSSLRHRRLFLCFCSSTPGRLGLPNVLYVKIYHPPHILLLHHVALSLIQANLTKTGRIFRSLFLLNRNSGEGSAALLVRPIYHIPPCIPYLWSTPIEYRRISNEIKGQREGKNQQTEIGIGQMERRQTEEIVGTLSSDGCG